MSSEVPRPGGEPMIWLYLDTESGLDDPRDAATSAIEAGIGTIVVPEGGADLASSLARVRIVKIRGDELVEEGKPIGKVVTISSREDVDVAIGMLARGRTVLLDTPDWTIIPLEDLVAARHGEGLMGVVLAVITSVEEARVALGALEHGVDGVAIRPSRAADVRPMVDGVRALASEEGALTLTVGTVVRVDELGLGDRACVDTVDIMKEGEGLLVGSTSAGFLLVHGETIENPYAAVRPFRVNAGAVHSYIIAPGGRTMYLSEALAGIRVLLVDRDGTGRPSHVGRLKIERRPLVLVEVDAGGYRFNAILQNAETVRLVTPAGHASVSGLEVGQKVIVYVPAPATDGTDGKGDVAKPVGRHFGRAVPERIIES